MKNKLKVIPTICLLGVLLVPQFVQAETLQDYIDKANKYTGELQEKKNQISANDNEVKKIQAEVADIQSQMEQIKVDQEKLQKQIEENNKKIKAKDKEIKNLVSYSQLTSGENFYLDYIFGADNLTDMIYRMSISEQISAYNTKVINQLNQLTEDNKTKKKQLAEKDIELKDLEKQLSEKKDKLNADSATIREGMPSVQEQIDQAEKMITFYRNKGCEPSDVIGIDCAVIKPVLPLPGGGGIASSGNFHRPVTYGTLTSSFGGRDFDDFHYGSDIGTNEGRYSTKVYPIASGLVYFVGYDIYGAKIVRIAHNYNGKIIGSTYVHLASFAPGISEGMEVSENDYIGIMGESGNAYGVHLHLEVSDCPYLYAGSACYGWNSYINHLKTTWQDPAEYINLPYSWSAR